MKAELIKNLILAHCSGNEDNFREAVEVLAKDEEKKGNVPLATKIRSAYKKKNIKENASSTSQTAMLSPSSGPHKSVPRDKDTLLELYEIIESRIELEDVILPVGQKNVIEQIIVEQGNVKNLLEHNLLPSNRLLLCGPPGCGKTMTAYAIAHELSLKTAYVRLDGLVSSYLGQTSANLRKIFDSFRDQRIVLFLDEFDAIAKKRDDSHDLGELKRVVTTLLQNFDSMPNNVFLIAATNHEHLLDPAIWRRFNVTVNLGYPNEEQRKKLLTKWFSEYKVREKLQYERLSQLTEGLSGAQIKEIVTASAKKYLIDKSLRTEDITSILLKHLTKYSEDHSEVMETLVDMLDRGVPQKRIAESVGVPATTFNYQVKKYKEKVNG